MTQDMDIGRSMNQDTPVFYQQDSGAKSIMTLANFPDDMLPLLQMENIATYEAMRHFRCNTLVELGCYYGRALEIARLLNARYQGIDLNPRAIKVLRERVKQEEIEDRVDTIVGDVLTHMSRGQLSVDSHTLYLLPFNFLGNFRDPLPLLKKLAKLDVTSVICVFSNSPEAIRVRHDYYLRCGVQTLELHSHEDGTLFTGADGFYSRSYTRSSFHSLLTRCGLSVIKTSENLLAYCGTVTSATLNATAPIHTDKIIRYNKQ